MPDVDSSVWGEVISQHRGLREFLWTFDRVEWSSVMKALAILGLQAVVLRYRTQLVDLDLELLQQIARYVDKNEVFPPNLDAAGRETADPLGFLPAKRRPRVGSAGSLSARSHYEETRNRDRRPTPKKKSARPLTSSGISSLYSSSGAPGPGGGSAARKKLSTRPVSSRTAANARSYLSRPGGAAPSSSFSGGPLPLSARLPSSRAGRKVPLPGGFSSGGSSGSTAGRSSRYSQPAAKKKAAAGGLRAAALQRSKANANAAYLEALAMARGVGGTESSAFQFDPLPRPKTAPSGDRRAPHEPFKLKDFSSQPISTVLSEVESNLCALGDPNPASLQAGLVEGLHEEIGAESAAEELSQVILAATREGLSPRSRRDWMHTSTASSTRSRPSSAKRLRDIMFPEDSAGQLPLASLPSRTERRTRHIAAHSLDAAHKRVRSARSFTYQV
ncbi:unnamed protein product [Amoebophrya sp. A120]|nr:unnamed protein product [Amoebophrya sp. A120]|eukprot:GSA120T00019026001.1